MEVDTVGGGSTPSNSANGPKPSRSNRRKHDNLSMLGGPGRKPRACVECRRLKMKCEIPAGDQRCKRCQRKDLDCVLSRGSTQSDAASLDSYEQKIDAMRNEIQDLQRTLNAMNVQTLTHSPGPDGAPSVAPYQTTDKSPSVLAGHISPAAWTTRRRASESHRMAMTRENSPEPAQGVGSGTASVLVTEPMGGLYEVTRLRNIRSNQAKLDRSGPESDDHLDDFIARGVISEEEAEDLYRIFHISLNHYLWVGLEQLHSSLASVRRSSQLLTATILTVTALHIPSSAKTFDDCYNEFLNLISSSMFSKYHSVDDVRGLCIAAFWLSDVSWKLSGHAIRIATELNIHQSFFKALEGDHEHFLRARLWYMLYVCDHHFSIAYGRPPMISESLQIREHETFLQLPLADALDFRILSQVNLFQILTRVHDCFAERRLPHQDTSRALLSEVNFPQMRSFNLEIDKWRILWHSRQKLNQYIGSFPPKGIILYSYFAKFQLNSFAVRGINLSEGILSTERQEFANMAVSAAASSLTFVLEEEDLRRALVGTPLYVHTMIAFTSVFLMKVATKWNAVGFNVDPAFVWNLLDRVIHLLKTTITSKRHLLYHIAAGLEKLRGKLLEQDGDSRPSTGIPPHTPRYSRVDDHQMSHLSYVPSQGPDVVPSDDCTMSSWADDSQLTTSTGLAMENDPSRRRVVAEPDAGLDQVMSMSSDLIYEVFGGNESSYDVYSLLSSQFAS